MIPLQSLIDSRFRLYFVLIVVLWIMGVPFFFRVGGLYGQHPRIELVASHPQTFSMTNFGIKPIRTFEGRVVREVDSSLYRKFEKVTSNHQRRRVVMKRAGKIGFGKRYLSNAKLVGTFDIVSEPLQNNMQISGANYPISNLDIEQGLKSNSVSTFYFAPNGDVWIGYVTGGVSCVRGKEIFHLGEREGLGNAEVTSIEGYAGSIWVGTFGGGLFRIENGRVHQFSGAEDFFGDHFVNLECYRGELWIGTFGNGLLRFDGRAFSQIDAGNVKIPVILGALGVDEVNNCLYFSAQNSSLVYRLNQNDEVDTFRLGSVIRQEVAISFIGTDRGVLHLLCRNGVHVKVKGDQAHVYQSGSIANHHSMLSSSKLGDTWIGDQNGSLWWSNGDTLKVMTHNEGMPKSGISTIGEDLNGNIWVGSEGHGVFVLLNSPFRTILSESNPLYFSKAFLGLHPNGILFPTTKGLSLLMENKMFIHFQHPFFKNVLGAVVDGERIWACNMFGFFELSHDSLFRYQTFHSTSHLSARLSRNGKELHLSNYNSGFVRYDIGVDSVIVLCEIKDFSLTKVTYEDSRGRIWLGSPTGGVSFLTGKERVVLSKDFGEVHAFAEDMSGSIWIGTAFGLLQYTAQGQLFSHTFPGFNAVNEIRALVYMPQENALWIGTAKGLLCYTLADHSVRVFAREQGISGTYFSAHTGISTSNSTYWMNNKGLLQYNWGSRGNQSRLPPNLRLVSVDHNESDHNTDWRSLAKMKEARFDSLEWGLPVNLELSYGVKRLVFHFSTGSWFASDDISLYYQIGQGGAWIRSSSSHSVVLYGPKSMDYEVFFKAVTADGRESQPIGYKFIVRKPFYLELWFMLLVAIVGGFLSFYVLKQAFRIRFENARSYSDQDAYLKRVRLIGVIFSLGLPISELAESKLGIPGFGDSGYLWMIAGFLIGMGLLLATYLRRINLEQVRQMVQLLVIALMLLMTVRVQYSDYAPAITIGFVVVFCFGSVILDNIQSFLRYLLAVSIMQAYNFVWIDTTNPDHLLFLTNFPVAFLFGGVYHVLQLYKISNLLFGDQILRVYDKYVLVCDPEGRVVYCNEYVLSELGLSEEFLLGEGWWSVLGIHQAELVGIREAIRARMAGDLSAEVFPGRLIKPNLKQPRTLQWEYQLIESGYLMGIGTDVSERIEQETMIRTLSLIASATENLVVITDVEGKVEWVNASFCRATEYAFEEVVGKNPNELLRGPETGPMTHDLEEAMEQGQAFRGEVAYYSNSGRLFWVLIDVQPILDEKGKAHNFVSISIDVTEKKLREMEMLKTIEESEHKYKLISDNTSDGIAILDAEGRFVFTSPSFLNILGYPAPTYLDADQAAIAALLHPDDREIPFRMHREAIARRREHVRYTYRVRHSAGNYVWQEDSATFVYDAENRYQKTYIIARDVTQDIQRDEEREQLLKELTHSYEELQQFSFITQHNLRAPVSNFLGLLNMIETEQIDHPLLPRFLASMRKTAVGFEQTIEDLNTVLRVKNRTEVTFSPVVLQTSLQAVLESHAGEILAAAPRIIADFSEAPVVRFSPQYMHSIFSSLITNALKFKAQGRTLEIDIHARIDDKMVCLTFSDNGIGLDVEKHQDRLFGLYQRFHGDRDGKGFGLYLLKSQVESAGGRVAAEGSRDQGFTVRIWLPSGADLA